MNAEPCIVGWFASLGFDYSRPGYFDVIPLQDHTLNLPHTLKVNDRKNTQVRRRCFGHSGIRIMADTH